MRINLFGEEQNEVSIWDNIEDYRGNHEVLSTLFVDGMKKEFGFVSNGKFVVTRNYHAHIDKVTFYVYSRVSFYRSETNYIRNLLDNQK